MNLWRFSVLTLRQSASRRSQSHHNVTQIYGISRYPVMGSLVKWCVKLTGSAWHCNTNQVTQWKETNSAGLSHLIFIDFPLAQCGCRMERARPKTRPLERSPTRCQNGTPSSALSVQAKGSAMLDRTWSNWGSNFPKNTPTKRMDSERDRRFDFDVLWLMNRQEGRRETDGNWSSIGQSRFRFCPSASLQILEICTATILLCRLAAIKCKRPSACLHWPTGVPGHMFGNVWNMVGTLSWWHSTWNMIVMLQQHYVPSGKLT